MPINIHAIAGHPDFVDITEWPFVIADLRYASTNNFLGRDLYGSLKRCYLHREAAEKFKRAGEILARRNPGFKFLVFDGLRPRSVQRVLWSAVVGTDQQKYIGNPDKGSIHNFGFAIDLSLADERGTEVDMGTIFDFFGELAEPQHEERFSKEGKLSLEQLDSRKLLREIMIEAGFLSIEDEWWHFTARPDDEVRRLYAIVE